MIGLVMRMTFHIVPKLPAAISVAARGRYIYTISALDYLGHV
jgi:hypothetical protein